MSCMHVSLDVICRPLTHDNRMSHAHEANPSTRVGRHHGGDAPSARCNNPRRQALRRRSGQHQQLGVRGGLQPVMTPRSWVS
eukprot:COSAG05_NODE_1243_length_5412_cov_2.064510_1_plen_82_part_00